MRQNKQLDFLPTPWIELDKNLIHTQHFFFYVFLCVYWRTDNSWNHLENNIILWPIYLSFQNMIWELHKFITLCSHLPQPPCRSTDTGAGATIAQLLPAAVKWNSNCPCPFLLNSQYSLFSRCPAGVSAAQNTKMWCSISAKNISAFLNVEYDSAILFIFWNWKTRYNLQRRIGKIFTAKTPTWIT